MAHSRVSAILSSLFLLVIFGLLLIPASESQVLSVGDMTSTPIEGAGHDYIKTLSETVNPANGSLSIRIQLPPAKGRGITLPFSFAYDSNGINYPIQSLPGVLGIQSSSTMFSSGGWTYTVPMLNSSTWSSTTTSGGQGGSTTTCYFSSGYVFQDPSGGRHNLGLGAASYASNGQYLCSEEYVNGNDGKYSAAMILPDPGQTVDPPVQVSDADGTVYYFSNPEASNPTPGYSVPPNYIEDRNGNELTNSWNSTTGAFTITDTAGRAAITSTGTGPTGSTNTVTVAGMSYEVAWTTTTPKYTFPSTIYYEVSGDYFCSNSATANSPETVISSITLPNGQQYHFYYGDNNPHGISNPYGLLSEIDYPSGAWVQYTWKWSDYYSEAVVFDAEGLCYAQCIPNVQEGCQLEIKTPVVATRTVGFGPGSSPALTQSFTKYYTSWESGGNAIGPIWSTKQTTVSGADNIRGLTTQTIYTYGSVPGGGSNNPYTPDFTASQLPVEQTIQYYNWGNKTNPIRTVNKTWLDQFDLSTQTTILNDSSKTPESEIAYTYTTGFTEPQTETKYDYGLGSAGPVLETTKWNYQTFATNPVGGVIADKPLSVITYDGNNNELAETDYVYDSYSGGISGVTATNHDNTNFPTSYTNRGNVTSKTVKCLQTGCANATTTYKYDETGEILSATDPCGNGTCSDVTGTKHTTSYSYADSYTVLSGGSNGGYTPPNGNTNAYLTKVSDPLGHTESFSYDYFSGQLTVLKDQNGQSTGYIYNDPLVRPTSVNYPDGGQATYSYNDSPYNPSTPSPSVTTTKTITSGVNEVNVVAFDGMGHPVETILSSDPAGPDYSTTTYDGFSRIDQATNPYRGTSDPTYGSTAYSYDALGRTTLVTHPDGTSVATSYAGRATSVQDEGNGTAPVQRISQVDGLGHLVSVCEVTSSTQLGPGGSPAACGQDIAAKGFLTTYQYNALDDLLGAQQAAVGRSFIYDSFSHLLTATNPESGTTSYTYDANGNVSTRTRPAPNQTNSGTTVTTSYGYDVLNRNTSITYSDGTTPSIARHYDTTMELDLGLDNTIGRESAEYVTNSAGTMVSGKVYSYDPLGRIINNSQCTALNCSSSTAFSITYSYDYLGQPLSSTNGEATTLSYAYDAAAHLTTVTSSLSQANYPSTLFSGATYNSFGSLTGASLGNALNEARAYDCRGRLLFYSSVVFPGVPSITGNNTPGCPNTAATNMGGEKTDILNASLTNRLKWDLKSPRLPNPFLTAHDPVALFDPRSSLAGVQQ